eukprot:667177-Amphidinium_carterae.1
MPSPDIEGVVQAGLCAGCGICESMAGPDKVRMETTWGDQSPLEYFRLSLAYQAGLFFHSIAAISKPTQRIKIVSQVSVQVPSIQRHSFSPCLPSEGQDGLDCGGEGSSSSAAKIG